MHFKEEKEERGGRKTGEAHKNETKQREMIQRERSKGAVWKQKEKLFVEMEQTLWLHSNMQNIIKKILKMVVYPQG